MAKHLTDKNINEIVLLIDKWDVSKKLTWEGLCVLIKRKLFLNKTRQTLFNQTRISESFKRRKKSLKNEPRKSSAPASIEIARVRIDSLTEENERLNIENNDLLAQFTVWQYNAYAKGMSMNQLNKPIPKKTSNVI